MVKETQLIKEKIGKLDYNKIMSIAAIYNTAKNVKMQSTVWVNQTISCPIYLIEDSSEWNLKMLKKKQQKNDKRNQKKAKDRNKHFFKYL